MALVRSSAEASGRENPPSGAFTGLGAPAGCRLVMWARDYFASGAFSQAGSYHTAGYEELLSVASVFLVRSVEDFVRNAQALERSVVHDVRIDDFVHILGAHTAVKNTLRVDGHRGSQLALIEASGLIGADQLDAALRQPDLEQTLQLALAGRIAAAARMAGLALVHTNEYMRREFGHRRVSI